MAYNVKTLYIDVYFLINFTVDILALHFSAAFSKIHTTVPRLLSSAFIGAMYAVVGILLINKNNVMYVLSALLFMIMVLIVSWGVGIYRTFKYAVSFLLFQIIIGGLVYYVYCMLDKLNIPDKLGGIKGQNQKLLILSLIVLLAIGVLKLIIIFFGNMRSEKSVRLEIQYRNREVIIDAFVDSGNLAVDPLDKTPVMLVTLREAKRIFGDSICALGEITKADVEFKKRMRVIPACFGGVSKLLYGIKPDSVSVLSGKKNIRISVLIAIDNEEDGYGGYSALVPLSALENVFYGNL